MYIQKNLAKKHYLVGLKDGAAVCLCGKARGSKRVRQKELSHGIIISTMKALVIKPEPMRKILSGSKCWEIRRGKCQIRGLVGLIESGSGTVVGVAELADCVGPLTREIRIRNARKMGVTTATAAESWPRDLYAWVPRKRQRLTRPVRYKHPSGIVRWVPLSPSVTSAVLRQVI
jgi:hypothetical protein